MSTVDLNQVTLTGRLGKDPDHRASPSGDSVASLNLASGWKTKNKEGTQWTRVVVFGKLADIVNEYTRKGHRVAVTGRLQTRQYDKDGVTHYVTEVIANTVLFLDKGSGNAAQARPSSPPPSDEDPGPDPDNDFYNDRIPF